MNQASRLSKLIQLNKLIPYLTIQQKIAVRSLIDDKLSKKNIDQSQNPKVSIHSDPSLSNHLLSNKQQFTHELLNEINNTIEFLTDKSIYKLSNRTYGNKNSLKLSLFEKQLNGDLLSYMGTFLSLQKCLDLSICNSNLFIIIQNELYFTKRIDCRELTIDNRNMRLILDNDCEMIPYQSNCNELIIKGQPFGHINDCTKRKKPNRRRLRKKSKSIKSECVSNTKQQPCILVELFEKEWFQTILPSIEYLKI